MPNKFVQIQAQAIMAAAGSTSRPIVNVYYYERNNTVLPLNKGNIQAAFQTTVMAPVLLATVSRYTQTYNGVRFIEDYTDAMLLFAQAGVGAITTDSLPDYCCVSMYLESGKRGGSNRGAKRFAGVAEASTTGDVLTGGGLTLWQAVQTAVGATFTDADGNVWSPVIVSQKDSTLDEPTTNVVSVAVTSVILNKNLGIMKRRKTARVV